MKEIGRCVQCFIGERNVPHSIIGVQNVTLEGLFTIGKDFVH
jgi:hypothetical protein